MKTTICINGQISGNFKLRNKIVTNDCVEKKGLFNSIIIEFKSKRAAINALSGAYQSFCNEMPEEKNSIAGFKYIRGYILSWDASRAIIQEN